MTRPFVFAILCAFAAACSASDAPTDSGSDTDLVAPTPPPLENESAAAPPTVSESTPVLSYADAFIMEPIGARDMTMGGITLTVEGGTATLTGASSPSVGTIELHTMAMSEGRMQMRQVQSLEIADGQTLELKRGGHHFMMFDIGEDVVAGETVDITLTLDADGAPMTVVVEADVRAIGE